MSDEWAEELKKMKEEEERKIQESKTKEEQLREKYKGDIKKTMDMIRAQCESVVEVFVEHAKSTVNETAKIVSLKLPIPNVASLELTFRLILTKSGYAVKVTREIYDHVQERVAPFSRTIQPPIDVQKIRGAIREFLEERKYAIERVEEKRRRQAR